MFHEFLYSFLVSLASVALSLWAIFIARSSLGTAEASLRVAENTLQQGEEALRQAERVADRERRDWKQRKWFDLYFKANEIYDQLDHFQAKHSSKPASAWGAPELQNEFANLLLEVRRLHSMAAVFPKDPAVDALFKSTVAFHGLNEVFMHDRLRPIADAVEGLRQKALVDTSVLS